VTEAILLGLLCHFLGDYFIQTDWMAREKTKHWSPAIWHGVTYGVPFVIAAVIMSSWSLSLLALTVIVVTHIVIDHFRLARHVIWFKNQLAPKEYRYSWSQGNLTGYQNDAPVWLTTWLMIITDNVIHVMINTAAILYL
jgi:hypothetical protein